MTWRDSIAIHPAADLFPMMPDDELATLAADIKENGQVQPIILGDYEGKEVIVDGRNRLKACEIAGVEPKFQKINGQDQKAYILSVNINRRHMTAGARAMAVAMIYPEGTQGKATETSFATKEVKSGSLAKARAVLKHARDLADGVLKGQPSLDAAYEIAITRKKEAESADEKMKRLRADARDLADAVTEDRMSLDEAVAKLEQRKREAVLLDTIRDESADLVALVEEGRMSVQDALAAHHQREKEALNQQRGVTMLLSEVVRLLDVHHVKPAERAGHLTTHFNPNLWPRDTLGEPDRQLFLDCAEMLKCFALAMPDSAASSPPPEKPATTGAKVLASPAKQDAGKAAGGPLVWTCEGDDVHQAVAPGGTYEIKTFASGHIPGHFLVFLDGGERRSLGGPFGLNEAKRMAQNHHNRRMQAAVVPEKPATTGVMPDIPAALDRRPGANGVAA
jgi:hypothetical protein